MSCSEQSRLAVLDDLCLLDTPPEPFFEGIVDQAQLTLGVPMVGVSLIDSSRQWFKAGRGMSVQETPRDTAFGHYTLQEPRALVVSDASKDNRFENNPSVISSPGIRAYLGVPLIIKGAAIGVVSAIDTTTRQWTEENVTQLLRLAELTREFIVARKATIDQEKILNEEREAFSGRALYETIVEQMAEGIAVQCANGRILAFNPSACEILGLLPEEIAVRTSDDERWRAVDAQGNAIDGDNHPSMRALALKQPIRGAIMGVDRPGAGRRWLRIDSTPVGPPATDSYIAVTTFTDITEAREREADLQTSLSAMEATQKHRADFLAKLSHEIRTPLNAMLGLAPVLQHSELDKNQSRLVETMLESGETVVSLLSDLLQVAKNTSGAFDLYSRSASLPSLLNCVSDLWSRNCAAKGIGFRVIYETEVPEDLVFDPVRVRQCLDNLISNAVKFTDEGYIVVTVRCVYEADRDVTVAFSVQDTGCGIAPEDLDLLFKPYSQVSGNSSASAAGTGLGLSLVRELSILMGGGVDARSELGKGSAFSFHFSAKTISEGKVGDGQTSQATAPSQKDKTILVVDDQELNRTVCRMMLDHAGYNVIEAEGGAAALECLSSVDVDAVILDLQMPGIDGLRTLQLIRNAKSKIREVPVIVMTADAFDERRAEAFSSGAQGFITKPFQEKMLLKQIDQLDNLEHQTMRGRSK